MPDDYTVKDNKYSKVYTTPDDPFADLPYSVRFFHLLKRITNYHKPPAEREIIVNETDPVSEFIKDHSEKAD